MNRICLTDWKEFDNLTDEDILANSAADPDGCPFSNGAKVKMRKEDGATVLERFRKAIKRERQNSFCNTETEKTLCREE